MQNLKRLVNAAMPGVLLHSIRMLSSAEYRQVHRFKQGRAVAAAMMPRVWKATDGQVATGPFAGLRYVEAASCSEWCPKLLGTYEKELAGVVDAIMGEQPGQVMVIGAAEGYYAVGLAVRLPLAKVIAFEANPEARALLDALATRNSVNERLSVHGFCGAAGLAESLESMPGGATIICDVEGGEFELLDPAKIPSLRRCRILVELHAWVVPDLAAILTERFGDGFVIQRFSSETRVVADFPAITGLQPDDAQKLACMDECRPTGMEWLWMVPKVCASAA
jgi:hypothetical protein